MTTTHDTRTAPRRPDLERRTAMRLAATEYARFAALLGSLADEDWAKPTECPGWDVRAMAAHAVGMAELAASIREQLRQVKAAERRGGVFIDALTELQVNERVDMAPAEIVARYTKIGPKAARARRRTPGLIRRHAMPQQMTVNARPEAWTVGYLIDVILTRDPWMHRVDITRATGAELVLTAEHDGILVDDVVREWLGRHGQPVTVRLTGAAGGFWTVGIGGPQLELGAVEFCRILSGRQAGEGLLSTEVPF
jgi:uncharacterized protein (TIGR03083 family)